MSQAPRAAAVYTLLILLAAGVGYYAAHKIAIAKSLNQPGQQSTSNLTLPPSAKNRLPARLAHPGIKPLNSEADPAFAIKNEKMAQFQNEDGYRKFLASMASRGLGLLDQSDRMLAVRFSHGEDFDPGELDDAELGYNYLVSIPELPDVQAQPGAVGFGQNALAWLGVSEDNAHWGKGITVAVIDSGVSQHIYLDDKHGKVSQITLTELGEGDEQLGHGTAVASIISGDHPLTPGIAPASDILSIRVTDAEGISNSFTLAKGILAAADAGAKIINISMGSQGNSSLVDDAIQYARQQGAVIVASSGNAGLDTLAYPAAYQEVIAVGAVEAQGEHLDFSNTGESLGIMAPGFQVNAAWGEEQFTSLSGTSASAPFVSGAIAATLSQQPQLTAQQAADLILRLSNDAGYPGRDAIYGNGILAIDRVMEYGTPGIYDAAVTSQLLIPASSSNSLPHILVSIQNQGTETLINSPVQITTPAGTQTINISSLAPGQIHSLPVPINLPSNGAPLPVSSSIQITEADQQPDNNSRSDRFEQPAGQ